MKTLLSIAFIAIIFAVTSYGQPTNDYKKNNIGLDLIPIVQNMIHSDSLIPYGITYCRFLTPNHALRLRVNGGFIKDYNDWGKSPIERKEWAFGFTVGYQYRVSLATWADILFAIDVGALWEQKKTWDILRGLPDMEDEPWMRENVDEIYERWEIIVVPTLELQLKWTQHISLALAVSPQYSYCHNNAETSDYRYSSITGYVSSQSWTHLLETTKQSITPVYNVSLLYSF